METPVRRKYIPPQRRRQILAAAMELFSHSGYHGVTVDAIAQQAGISKGNLYWHFKSKREILQLLLHEIVERLFLPPQEVLESDAPPREKLRAITKRLLDTAEANPEAVSLMLQMAAQSELREIASSHYSFWMRHYVNLIAPLFASLGEDDPERIAMLYAATIDGLMALVVLGPRIYDKEKLMAALEQKFLSSTGGKDV